MASGKWTPTAQPVTGTTPKQQNDGAVYRVIDKLKGTKLISNAFVLSFAPVSYASTSSKKGTCRRYSPSENHGQQYDLSTVM